MLIQDGRLIFDKPLIMGILNITPDSFFDGGVYSSEAQQLKQVEKMLMEGADIIDIGAISTRPGAAAIPEKEESKRLLPIVASIMKAFGPVAISVDTYRSTVAKRAIEQGASMVNDISAGELDPNMATTVQQLAVPYIIMHMKGSPQTMQNNPIYINVLDEVKTYLLDKAYCLHKQGIKSVIVDPGFGFGKTLEHNYQMLHQLEKFKGHGFPLLVGLSRKSMIYKILQSGPEEALNGTSVLNTVALLKGADILRVHDVKEAVECVKLVSALTAKA
jgi:dihydropteroate synthase